MIDAVFSIVRDTERRDVALASYLDAAGEERALTSAYGWIKSLRHAHVDGVPLRRRFTTRGDSLWWFAELYLHKQEVILALFKVARRARDPHRTRTATLRATDSWQPAGEGAGASFHGVEIDKLQRPVRVRRLVSLASCCHRRSSHGAERRSTGVPLAHERRRFARGRCDRSDVRSSSVLASRHRRWERRSLHRPGARRTGSAPWRRQGGVRQRRPGVELSCPPVVAPFSGQRAPGIGPPD